MCRKQLLTVIHIKKKKTKLEGSFQRYNTNLIKAVNSLILVELCISFCLTFCHCFHTPKVSQKIHLRKWDIKMLVLKSGLHERIAFVWVLVCATNLKHPLLETSLAVRCLGLCTFTLCPGFSPWLRELRYCNPFNLANFSCWSTGEAFWKPL